MHHFHLPLRDTHAFSSFFLDYIEQKPALSSFYNRFPLITNFADQIRAKSERFSAQHRNTLADTLLHQYKELKKSAAVEESIHALRQPNTFTVTTGHQLNIFTGPLYFVYKIVTTINTCKALQSHYPQHRFVPVYWMASEDHDYEEIKAFRLHGKKYTWNTGQTGAVGRFSLDTIKDLLQEVPGTVDIFKEAYTTSKTLADAVRHYVNALFGNEGLVVVDADDHELKKQFVPIIKADVFDGAARQRVDETNTLLKQAGYHVQVHARDINFFYLNGRLRARIERSGNEFTVVDTDLRFNESQLTDIIEQSPEQLSPNVILRPVYQEVILPNLAYVGGPAEVVYWLQLKGVFDQFNIPFPILMPRNFALIVDAPTHRKLNKTGLELRDFFEDKNYIFNHWITKNAAHLTLGDEMKSTQRVFELIKNKGASVDATLIAHISAQEKQVLDRLQKIEHKLLKAEKRRHTDRLNQIAAVKDALFPNGGLQERIDNFLNFYQQDQEFIGKLTNAFNPFDFRFNVLCYA